MRRAAFAPAKVNLYLHVGPVGADGYHPIASLAAFADVGDRISVEPSERFEVTVTGPFATGVPAGPDNFVAGAVAALPGVSPKLRLTIDKQLPVAAGLGGGSSDAAAVLRLLRDERLATAEDASRAARATGADGLACLAARPVIMRGRGDDLAAAPPLPMLQAVLVNPQAACSTGAVYRAYDAGQVMAADEPQPPPSFGTAADVAAWLGKETRNDLERPAQQVQPAVTEVLDWLRARPEPLLVRMSGSGATVFALFQGAEEAHDLANIFARERPNWWARACRLGGPWPTQSEPDRS